MDKRVSGGLVAGLGSLAVALAAPAAAQLRMGGAPVSVQRSTSVSARTETITIRTDTLRPGVSETRITVRDGAPGLRATNGPPGAQTLSTVPMGTRSIRVLVERDGSPARPSSRPAAHGHAADPARETRVTVSDVSRASGTLGGPPLVGALSTARGPRQTVTIIGDGGSDDAGILIVVE